MGYVNAAVYASGASGELIFSIRIYTRELDITKLQSQNHLFTLQER